MGRLRKDQFSENSSLGIWRITESLDDMMQSVRSLGFEMDVLKSYKSELKVRQWLAARLLLNDLDPGIRKVHYKESGAPYILDGPFISMSHSHEMVAVYLDGVNDLGVDLQHITEKIVRIKEKFCSKEELQYVQGSKEIEKLVVLWSCKEAVYKRMKIEGLIFSEQILVDDFELQDKGQLRVRVKQSEVDIPLQLKYEILEDYTLVYTYNP